MIIFWFGECPFIHLWLPVDLPSLPLHRPQNPIYVLTFTTFTETILPFSLVIWHVVATEQGAGDRWRNRPCQITLQDRYLACYEIHCAHPLSLLTKCPEDVVFVELHCPWYQERMPQHISSQKYLRRLAVDAGRSNARNYHMGKSIIFFNSFLRDGWGEMAEMTWLVCPF